MAAIETLESLRDYTDYIGLAAMQLTIFYLSEATEENFLLYYSISIEILIIDLMWVCVVAKWFAEISERDNNMIKLVFFYKYIGLSYIATCLCIFTPILAWLSGKKEIVGILLIWQLIHASADLELSEQKFYRKRHTFAGFCLSIILCPILARREITDRLMGQEFCAETLESLVGFHKRTCLAVLLSAMGVALLKKDMAYDILFPAEYNQNSVRNLVDCAFAFPIIPYWMVIITSAACSVNLWYPMMMQQLMFDAGSLLIDEVYYWYLDEYGGIEQGWIEE